jgi:opacity protein-like surface antigen
MKKILFSIVLFVLALGAVNAQDNTMGVGFSPSSYYTFSWNVTFPMGDFNDWVSEPSAAGFDFGGKYLLPGANGLFAGFNLGWQRVAKIEKGTYTIPDKGIAITAKNYRFTWMVPFQAMIGYHLRPDKTVSPYAGLGIGGDYMEHHLMVQEYDVYKERWDFSLTPEIGATAKFGNFSQWGATVAVNYKWTTNKIEFYQTESKNLQMLNLKVGLSFIIR